jgi:carbonic anhydrase
VLLRAPRRHGFLGLRAGLVACLVVAMGGATAGPLADAAQEPHWDYHSHGGPEGWGELTEAGSSVPAFPDCNLSRQSPVDVPRSADVEDGLVVDYRATKLAVVNNGHTVQVNYEPGSTMSAGGKTYRLLQFHFHTPSEHHIHGRAAALEVHFVHQADDGELAVIGVLIEEGVANASLEPILDVMPDGEHTVNSSSTISAADLLPGDLSHYAYEGSLTTPPCTEGVKWHVLRRPITASGEQIARFRMLPFLNHDGALIGNARPVQPLNGRLGVPGTSAGAPEVVPPSTGTAGLASR